jgi:hypothetical protein
MRVSIYQNIRNYKVTVQEPKKALRVIITEKAKPIKVTINQLGARGYKGKSNYEIAQDNGFLGSEIEWLESQKNIDGGLIY